MLAVVEKIEDGYRAMFKRSFSHPIDKVWTVLTENHYLEKWMSNLEVVDLRKGGTIKFNMNDEAGASFDIKITDFKECTTLQFEWGEDSVRFELYSEAHGCLLILKESIEMLSDHTAKDLAGWHVCLDIFEALLNGEHKSFSKEDWSKRYEDYKNMINRLGR